MANSVSEQLKMAIEGAEGNDQVTVKTALLVDTLGYLDGISERVDALGSRVYACSEKSAQLSDANFGAELSEIRVAIHAYCGEHYPGVYRPTLTQDDIKKILQQVGADVMNRPMG